MAVVRRQWYSREARALCARVGVPDPSAAIRRLAADLVDRAGFDGPPFDPEVLASFRDVVDVRRIEMASAGRLRPSPEGLVIEVNASHSPGKQNLTINHETTHTLMPTYDGRVIVDDQTGLFDRGGREEELLCDIGGAALLLDERWLRTVVWEAGPSLGMLTYVAALFGSSLQAAAWQLSAAMPWPSAFVFWEPGLRTADRRMAAMPMLPMFSEFGGPALKWRVTHAYRSPTFASFIPRDKSTDNELVCACCEEVRFTYGHTVFEFCDEPLYCESLYSPYRNAGGVRERIISIVTGGDIGSRASGAVPTYQLEVL